VVVLRYYSVPFSSKNDEKLIFNLSTRELLICGSGVLLGVLVAGIVSLCIKAYMISCLPVAIPFSAVGALLAFKKVNKIGCQMTLYDYLLRKYYFSKRPRHYLHVRKETD